MTQVRQTEIAAILTRWLDRYSPPLQIKDKPRARQDEAEALLRVLLKFAPTDNYTPWVNCAMDQMEYQMKTRAWPTKGELGAICNNLAKERMANSGTATAGLKTPAEIAAQRILAGEMVDEEWIYGHNAVGLLVSGAVSESDLRPYRSSLFFSMKSVWGEEKATRMVADLVSRHAAAADVNRTRVA